MKLTKAEEKSYEAYKRMYARAEAKQTAKGKEMNIPGIVSKNEYQELKKYGRSNKQIVADQTYEISEKQALARVDAMVKYAQDNPGKYKAKLPTLGAFTPVLSYYEDRKKIAKKLRADEGIYVQIMNDMLKEAKTKAETTGGKYWEIMSHDYFGSP